LRHFSVTQDFLTWDKSNWLPAPKEPFYMLMRIYLPKIEVLNGQYEIPGVVKVMT